MTLYRNVATGEQIRPSPGDSYEKALAADAAYEVVEDELYAGYVAPASAPAKPSKKAAVAVEVPAGGVVSASEQVLVGENGPETVIPLTPPQEESV